MRDNNVAKELVQLLVVPDGELQVTGDNTLLLVVARRVTRKLEDLSSQVLKYCREVNCNRTEQCAEFEQVQLLTRGTSTNALRIVTAL